MEERRHSEMDRFRVNLLCIIGAAIGLSAVFVPWVNFASDVTLIEVITNIDPVEFGFGIYQSAACMVFIAGVAMAFLTQVGAYLEAAGAVAFMHAGGHLGDLSTAVHPGFYMALISIGLIVVSQIVLLEIGYPFRVERCKGPVPIRDRFYSYRPRVNYPGDVAVSMRLAGFAIAVTSLQLALVETWSANIPSVGAEIQRVTEFGYDASVFFMSAEGLFDRSILVWLGVYAFVGGTALALTASRAGMIQVLGSLLVLGGVYMGNPYGLEGSPSNVVYGLGQGFYVGLLAGVVTCTSFVYSAVVRHMRGRRIRWVDLFFTSGS